MKNENFLDILQVIILVKAFRGKNIVMVMAESLIMALLSEHNVE